MANLVWIDKEQGISGHSEEDIRKYNFNKRYRQNKTLKRAIQITNCSEVQFKIKNQRSK